MVSQTDTKIFFLLPTSHKREAQWDGEDFIIDSTECNLPYWEKRFGAYTGGEFAFATWIAKQWGFLSDDESTLGPNVSFEPCTYSITDTWPKVVISGTARDNPRKWRGHAYEYGEGLEPMVNANLWKVEGGWIKFSRSEKGTFTGLTQSYENLVGTLTRDIMVYCDLVDTSIVGNQRHQLLREVRLQRKGEGRTAVEPYHRQWK